MQHLHSPGKTGVWSKNSLLHARVQYIIIELFALYFFRIIQVICQNGSQRITESLAEITSITSQQPQVYQPGFHAGTFDLHRVTAATDQKVNEVFSGSIPSSLANASAFLRCYKFSIFVTDSIFFPTGVWRWPLSYSRYSGGMSSASTGGIMSK